MDAWRCRGINERSGSDEKRVEGVHHDSMGCAEKASCGESMCRDGIDARCRVVSSEADGVVLHTMMTREIERV